MKKYLSKILILVILIGIFVPTYSALAQTSQQIADCQAMTGGDVNAMRSCLSAYDPSNTGVTGAIEAATGVAWDVTKWISGKVISKILAWIFYVFMKLAGWILYLSGMFLNFILDFTVVNMRDNIGTIKGINIAWKVIKDLMNIGFIFLLLYQAITLIIGQSSTEKIGKTVAMIVLSALLINFSLFFTKVLIDSSNIVTLGLYNSILGPVSADPLANTNSNRGLSNKYQQALGLQGLNSSLVLDEKTQDDYSAMVFNLMTTILLLVVTFVFFAVGIMFIIRYITLVFLLALSPIAYMGMAFPFINSYSKQWWDSLKGQLLFGPIFMLFTWVILTLIANGISGVGLDYSKWPGVFSDVSSARNSGSINLLFNYALVIGLTILSLVTAKSVSTKGSTLIGQATSGLTSLASTTVMGGSAWVGRKTVGLTGNAISNNATLQEMAEGKNGRGTNIMSRTFARTALYGSKTARDATFDVRNASIPTSAIGDLIEGTAGRTNIGKKMGLNNVNIPSIPVVAPISNIAGTGKGGTVGYKEEKAKSDKEVREREAKNAEELAIAQAKRDVNAGKNAVAGTPDGDLAISKMEQALAKMSDKQTEALVAVNRDLLESQNFANAISVRQLEALNKSDQFDESEKTKLKNTRFSSINTAMATGNPTTIAGIRNEIRNLSDSEIEMLDPKYLGDEHFVSNLKSGQIDSINKSSRFTTSQRTQLREARRKPLNTALSTGNAAHATGNATAFTTAVADAEKAVRNLGSKEVAALDLNTVLKTPTMAETYNKEMLKRMAPEMNPADIPDLRAYIIATLPSTHPAHAWLLTRDGINNFS